MSRELTDEERAAWGLLKDHCTSVPTIAIHIIARLQRVLEERRKCNENREADIERLESEVTRLTEALAAAERTSAFEGGVRDRRRAEAAEAQVRKLTEALNAEREHAKFASDEHGKADAECERLQADVSDLRTRIAELEAVLDQESKSRLEACEALAAANARIKAVQDIWENSGARALHDALEKL